VARKAEPFLNQRRDDGWTITNREDAVKGIGPGQFENRLRRRGLVREADGNRPVLPGILEHIAAVGREHQVDAVTLGCVTERARLISGRRGEEKNSGHD